MSSGFAESSGSLPPLAETAEPWLKPQQSGATTLQPTGGTSTGATSSMEVALSFFAIEDSRERLQCKETDLYVTTYDCYSATIFWQTLTKAPELVEKLIPNQVQQAQVQKRLQLLGKLLHETDGQHRFALVAVSPEAPPRPIGVWMQSTIAHAETRLSIDEAIASATASKKPVSVLLRNLYDDDLSVEATGFAPKLASDADRRYLDEIFSLNHVPDADFGPGTVTPPPEPAPIVLGDGGFRFELDDAEFWKDHLPRPGHFKALDEATIEQDQEPGTALCVTTNESFEVYADVPGVVPDDEYAVYLVNEQRAFAIRVADPKADSELRISPVIYIPHLRAVEGQEGVILTHIANEQLQFSPAKNALSTPVRQDRPLRTPGTPQRPARRPEPPSSPYKTPKKVKWSESPSSSPASEDIAYSPVKSNWQGEVFPVIYSPEKSWKLVQHGLFYVPAAAG